VGLDTAVAFDTPPDGDRCSLIVADFLEKSLNQLCLADARLAGHEDELRHIAPCQPERFTQF
jgi:hypothetical protein